jgi:hypothetical protein
VIPFLSLRISRFSPGALFYLTCHCPSISQFSLQAIIKQLKPVVVHCSAGVGRTGVFCAMAIGIKSLQEEQKIDLSVITKHLRTQRSSMIQTAEQYVFVYRCIIDYLDMSIGLLSPHAPRRTSSYLLLYDTSRKSHMAVPVVTEETLYQNVSRPKRVPPKPPTRAMPPAPGPSIDLVKID